MSDIATPTLNASGVALDFRIEYERLRPQYLGFTEKLETLLRDLLIAGKIDFHLLESRTKEPHSFFEKVSRSTKKYSDPLNDVTDLSALRVITYYQDDADAIGRLIESEFLVDTEDSTKKTGDPAEFGYKSDHYVVRLSDTRSRLLEWRNLARFRAEIQVRTVLQHAWAAISHKLQYKHEQDVPIPLKRKLFRLSALFEVADDEFVSLREASNLHFRAVSTLLSEGDKRIAIDYVSLGQFISNSPLIAELDADAADVGFSFEEIGDPDEYDSDTLSDLVRLSNLAGIQTVAEFETMLNGAAHWAKDYLDAQFKASNSSNKSQWHVTSTFVCLLILLWVKSPELRLGYLLKDGWSRSMAKRVFDIASGFNGKSAQTL